ncbi:LOW QUALITY PROTEIN: putative receptor-like protein kinase At4g39110 [Curcuma longa]|uniref:LOW QUALITY PROTEIN: putative receptor-like protein kinase At4g39110 n=1 Tax=Curcuma longa TaxID=136217 RepID=UPI003D9DBE74
MAFATPTAAGAGAASASTFTPADNFLLDCGATTAVPMPDGRAFETDAQSAQVLSAADDVSASVPSVPGGVPSPLYLSARIFRGDATYSFALARPGWHWIRLHFFPVEYPAFNLTEAVFSVSTEQFVLLHSFSVGEYSRSWVLREFLVNATDPRLALHFSPHRNSVAFVNGIEVVSAPDALLPDSASTIAPVGETAGLSLRAFQVAHRINVGGPAITSANDTLGRTWDPDAPFLQSPTGKNVSVSPGIVKYREGVTPLIAPNSVYATAVEMADAAVANPNFNVTWSFPVNPSFAYLLRLHFCDIVSKSLNDLYFNVYVNGQMAISGLDLSTITGELASAYYKDIILNASVVADQITVQIGPMKEPAGQVDALLNGVEILKLSNSVGSLAGEFGVDGSRADDGNWKMTMVAVGFAMMLGAFVGLGAMVLKWRRRSEGWERRGSFSSWLLPVHAGNMSFAKSSAFASSTMGFGRYLSLAELQRATKNFDKNAVVGVGGFGNVYLGELEDGTKVAVKRGNPQSEQGINEFQTEIQMLSKLRHRHLVSLIGYCDENSEMILVYEYMANGPFRDHLYGNGLPPLSWKQRLEICIGGAGAARGLHYLHTGTAQGIIHRDVKSTNILLDDAFVAKVSDFGLSKDAPGMNQTHVSTAVKGSFGYLDPEYFRSQQLTDKSDVYSFGVVLLEALCARPALDPALPREQVNLAEWALQWKRKGLIEKIVDSNIAGTINQDSLNKFADAAEKCLANYSVDRPSMGDVLWSLEYALQMQEANPPAAALQQQQHAAAQPREDKEASGTSTSPLVAAPTINQSLENSSTAMANALFEQFAAKGR